MKLTDKQKKWFWVGAIVLVLIYYGPRLINTVYQPAPVRAKPSPAIPARTILPVVPVAPPPPSPAQVLQAQLAKMPGIWGGGVPVPNVGICEIHLELKTIDEKNFTGDSAMSCGNLQAFRPGQRSSLQSVNARLQEMKPVAAKFSGVADDKGAIVLHQDLSLGDRDGCNITDLSLVPFGDSNLGVTWKEGPLASCAHGQVVMHKVPAL
jgi:hypothetical protein